MGEIIEASKQDEEVDQGGSKEASPKGWQWVIPPSRQSEDFKPWMSETLRAR